MKYLSLFAAFLSPFLWAGEETQSNVAQLNALELLQLNQVAYPTLGLDVINLEDDGLVLRSKDSRFFVKGIVTDMWDGVSEPLTPRPNIEKIPTVLEPQYYAMVFGEGDEFIRLYLTPSCTGCMLSLDTLNYYFDPFKHRIELVWLFNNADDKKTVQHLLCRAPALNEIGKVIQESLDLDSANCDDPRLVIGHTLSRHQKVYALPYYTTSTGHYIQPIKNNPFK